MTRRYELDFSTRRLENGRVLLGGSPLCLFRLSERGAAVLDALLAGNEVAGSEQLARRLVDAGVLHPLPLDTPWTPADVTVVIPVLAADVAPVLNRVGTVHEVLVVDDGSEPPLVPPSVGPVTRPPVRMLRRALNGGPAAARNTGLAEVTTPLVAFVDADSRPEPDWLEPLLAHLADPSVVAVAPRMRAFGDLGPLNRFDGMRSPLDLGPLPARVRARTRVSYVPAAALLARTAVLCEHGGFDEALRWGEDVDLVWRLDESGACVRYEPRSVVAHRTRSGLRAWVEQRFRYGTSAAPLARRHPGALPPVAVSGWSVAGWGLAAAGHPGPGAGVAVGTAIALSRKLRGLDHPAREALRLAGLGHLFAGRLLASAITRAWWPIAAVAATRSHRARRALAVAAVLPALVDWWRRDGDELGPAAYVALRVLDDAAYGAGVWAGAARAQTLAPLVPDLTSWPRPHRYERARSATAAYPPPGAPPRGDLP